MNIMKIGDARKCIEEEGLMMNTWILDPPYNIGFDYQSDFKDNKKPDVYASELVDIIHTCARSLRYDGSLFIIHYPEIISRLVSMIESNKLKDVTIMCDPNISWNYISGLHGCTHPTSDTASPSSQEQAGLFCGSRSVDRSPSSITWQRFNRTVIKTTSVSSSVLLTDTRV